MGRTQQRPGDRCDERRSPAGGYRVNHPATAHAKPGPQRSSRSRTESDALRRVGAERCGKFQRLPRIEWCIGIDGRPIHGQDAAGHRRNALPADSTARPAGGQCVAREIQRGRRGQHQLAIGRGGDIGVRKRSRREVGRVRIDELDDAQILSRLQSLQAKRCGPTLSLALHVTVSPGRSAARSCASATPAVAAMRESAAGSAGCPAASRRPIRAASDIAKPQCEARRPTVS